MDLSPLLNGSPRQRRTVISRANMMPLRFDLPSMSVKKVIILLFIFSYAPFSFRLAQPRDPEGVCWGANILFIAFLLF